jgi:hypothetical protein
MSKKPKIGQIGRSAAKMIRVCDTCPFLKVNHGKPHPAKWYSIKNLRRLWNGLRTGKAPGMVCHSSDPNNKDYGGDKNVKPGHEQECAGALILMIRHANEYGRLSKLAYKVKYPLGLTLRALATFVEAQLFGQLPSVEDRSAEVGLPWENDTSGESDASQSKSGSPGSDPGSAG